MRVQLSSTYVCVFIIIAATTATAMAAKTLNSAKAEYIISGVDIDGE
jgi:hypothetical protein